MYRPKRGDAFYVSLTYLHYMYFYPFSENLKCMKKFYLISILIRIVGSFVMVGCALHVVMSLKDNIPVDINEDIALIIATGNYIVVCYLFQKDTQKWSNFLRDVADTRKFGTPPTMMKTIRESYLYVIIYLLFCIGGTFSYAIISIWFDAERCMRKNQAMDLHEICGTTTPMWLPQHDLSPSLKFAISLYQLISNLICLPPAAMLSALTWEVSEVLTSKITHLKMLIAHNCFEVNNKWEKEERVKFCIRYHQEILRLGKEFNGLFRTIFGHVGLVAALILSWIMAQIMKNYSIGAILHFLACFIGIFMICRTGQNIQDETYEVQDAIYESDWLKAEGNLVRDLKFIVLRCNKPVHLLARPLGIINYSLFITIVKAAYSYVTLITNSTR